MKKLNEILGTKYPFIQGGMANIATGTFAAAVSNAGALGLIGAGGMTADMLREQIHICRSECCRFFKKCMNESLFDYLLDYRIEKSLPLLLERQASITSVAEQTGFSSPAYFSKIFRQQMGCSPSEYRNRADHT